MKDSKPTVGEMDSRAAVLEGGGAEEDEQAAGTILTGDLDEVDQP